jgi:hypothetical protein
MTWRSQTGRPARVLGGATAVLALAALALAAALFAFPLSVLSLGLLLLSLLSLLGAVLTGLLLATTRTMRFRLGSDAVEVQWLSHRAMIPYADIDGVFGGSRLGTVLGTTYISTGGCRIGEARDASGKPVYFFVTTPDRADLSILSTDSGVFVLSPVSGPAFRRELIARLEAAEVQEASAPLTIQPWPLQPPRDPFLLITLGVSLVLLLGVLGVLFDAFGSLPDQIGLQFEADGRPTAASPRAHVFILPAIGAVSLLANTLFGYVVFTREPVFARLLWMASPLVQALVLVSLLRVLH